jgi:hypothetical protein
VVVGADVVVVPEVVVVVPEVVVVVPGAAVVVVVAGLQLCGVVNTPPLRLFPGSSAAHAACSPVTAAPEDA